MQEKSTLFIYPCSSCHLFCYPSSPLHRRNPFLFSRILNPYYRENPESLSSLKVFLSPLLQILFPFSPQQQSLPAHIISNFYCLRIHQVQEESVTRSKSVIVFLSESRELCVKTAQAGWSGRTGPDNFNTGMLTQTGSFCCRLY